MLRITPPLFAILLLFSFGFAKAQEPIPEQPAPFSAWLDFDVLARSDATPSSLPLWLESFQEEWSEGKSESASKTVFRIRLRRMPQLHTELLLRVFFKDAQELRPVVTAWDETGQNLFRSHALGAASGLQMSESVIVPVEGVDYLDIEFPGDGTNAKGVLLSSLKEVQIRKTQDFGSVPALLDPFGNVASLELEADTRLFGRVKAGVDEEIVRFSSEEGTDSVWLVELATQPSLVLVSFEVSGVDAISELVFQANGQDERPVSIFWPDLADPAYQKAAPTQRNSQYAGWLRAQCLVPGAQFQPGVNEVRIGLSQLSEPIVIRNLELQLKQE